MDKLFKRGQSEQGAALVMAIISLFIITGLATAMLASARTEFLIANNEERAVHARTAAEAGLNHGVQVVADRLVTWRSTFATPQLAVTDLLDNGGSLVDLGLAAPGARTTLSTSLGTSYEVRSYDDDDTAAVRKITLNSADITRIQENTNVTTDANSRIVVHAVGYGPGATTTRLEAIVGPLFLPAVVSNGNMTIGGTVNIVGSRGSVHSNATLDLNGGSGTITEDCTASGSMTGNTSNCGGNAASGRPTVTVPNVWAADYIGLATHVLRSDGRMYRQSPVGTFTLLCDASSDSNACKTAGYGWMFNSGNAGWDLGSTNPPNGAFYIEGNVAISGSPGPVQLSIIAEGYIDISGSPNLTPFLPETFLVTNKDLEISGTLSTPVNVEGQVLVREQAFIHGNVALAGQVIIQDASTTCTLVTSNTISGSVTITYNGIVGSSNFAVLSWKEIR